jgi:hypothetical protein
MPPGSRYQPGGGPDEVTGTLGSYPVMASLPSAAFGMADAPMARLAQKHRRRAGCADST